MSDNDNKWEQPAAPPPPLFTGKKEKDLVKQVTDEVMERVIGTSILYYPISVKHSDFHPLYGEAINKTYLPPIHVEVLAEWQGEETTTTGFGIDKKSAVTIHFHKRRLTEDQNLFVREGDFIQYGEQKYEIITLGQPRQLFGQPDAKIEISAQCIRARDGTFPSEAYPDPEEDDPRFTAAPACDPINEIRVLTGDTTSTGGSGEQPCGEVYERPGTPPPPLFTGKKETDLVKQVGDELLERVVGQQVVYFPISVPYSDFHDLYGEAINKTFLPPIRVFAAVEWKGSDTTTTSFGIDKMSAIDVKFHKRRLTEDQNLFVREGDFVLYGKILYEITKIGQPRLLFGKIDEKYEVVASCVRAREGTFRLSEVEGTVNEFDLDSVTACDNANLVIPDGVDNTMANVGSGEGIFKNKTGIQFNMKTLVEGENIVITSDNDTITIASAGEISGTITHAHTASYVEVAQTASYVAAANIDGTVLSASFAHTASYVETAQTASYVAAASIDGTVLSASHAASAHTASYVEVAQTASYVAAASIDGTVLSASHAASALTASYIETAQTASYVAAASIDGTVLSASHALTASHYEETDTLDSVLSRGSASTSAASIGALTASSLQIGGHILPDADEVYDIGSPTKQIRDLYVSTGSIVFGGTHKISVDSATGGFAFSTPEAAPSFTNLTAAFIDVANVGGLSDYVASSQSGIQAQIDALVAQIANIEYGGGGGGNNAGSGSVSVAVADGGAGILTMIDDGDGPNRAILQEYASNPVAHAGKTLYITDILGGSPLHPFIMANKFYFNEGGVWHKSPFYTDQPLQSPYTSMPTDMHDILNLDGTHNEDRAILHGLHENAASYGGRAIYLRTTGSSPIGDFIEEGKYYFNEGGIWHASNFYAKEEDEE